VLARVSGSDEVRAARLRRIARNPDAKARLAAARAARSLPPQHAAPLLDHALGDDDPRVAAEAAAAVAWIGVPLSRQPGLADALGDLGRRVARHPELASPWITAVRVLELRAALPALQQLARHPAPGLHQPATELLREWGVPTPDGRRDVRDALPADRMPDTGTDFHVELRTTAGTFEVALDTERAPAASMRLIERVRGGFLDERPVGPVLAGALLGFQTGGGSVLLRHEDAPVRVEAGSVLLLDHGRDTADGTLAVALSRRPAMDGRFTVLGSVTRGMQVLHALHEWDRILEARVRVGQDPAAPDQKDT
jgi:cyclophilin family peptidyl-prolyl cis-trans isomerase